MTREILAAERWNCRRERLSSNFAWNARLPRRIQRSFTCRKSTTWDRRFYFPSEGRHAEDFFALKNATALAGFEPVNLGTKGQHATSRPPKLLLCIYNNNDSCKGGVFRFSLFIEWTMILCVHLVLMSTYSASSRFFENVKKLVIFETNK
jgi:hypothetical protein